MIGGGFAAALHASDTFEYSFTAKVVSLSRLAFKKYGGTWIMHADKTEWKIDGDVNVDAEGEINSYPKFLGNRPAIWVDRNWSDW